MTAYTFAYVRWILQCFLSHVCRRFTRKLLVRVLNIRYFFYNETLQKYVDDKRQNTYNGYNSEDAENCT